MLYTETNLPLTSELLIQLTVEPPVTLWTQAGDSLTTENTFVYEELNA